MGGFYSDHFALMGADAADSAAPSEASFLFWQNFYFCILFRLSGRVSDANPVQMNLSPGGLYRGQYEEHFIELISIPLLLQLLNLYPDF